MLMGYVGSASAVGPGYLGNLTGNTYNIGNTFSALAYLTGNFGGSYGGVLQALPVPEPDTHAMLLAACV